MLIAISGRQVFKPRSKLLLINDTNYIAHDFSN